MKKLLVVLIVAMAVLILTISVSHARNWVVYSSFEKAVFLYYDASSVRWQGNIVEVEIGEAFPGEPIKLVGAIRVDCTNRKVKNYSNDTGWNEWKAIDEDYMDIDLEKKVCK